MKNPEKMKICIHCAFVFLLLGAPPRFVYGQDAALIAYKRNFARSNLVEKAEIVRKAADDPSAAAFLGELCAFALRFCLEQADLFATDTGDGAEMTALIQEAADGAAAANYKAASETLLSLCLVYGDPNARISALEALSVTAWGDGTIIDGMNRLLQDQNSAFASGLTLDYRVLQAGVAALGTLGDESSYTPVFAVYVLPYPDEVLESARAALLEIQGDYRAFLARVIRNNPPAEKVKAFNLVMSTDSGIPVTEKNLMAQTALEVGLAADDADSYTLRYDAALALTALGWTGASDVVIRHFYQTQTDYANGKADKERFIEAINCLGAMRTSDAAGILAIQLGLFNSQEEQNGEVDEAIVLAVLNALGGIGDKVAFDHLLYVAFLPYSNEVKLAAKDALSRLRW